MNVNQTYAATQRARAQRAKAFAEKWHGRGYEKGDTASFWLELLRDVIGMTDVTTAARFESSTNKRGYIDVVIRDAKTMIEQKSLGVDLDKPELRQGVMVTPYQQARNYANSLRNSERPDTIIVCDFDHFRIHDLDSDDPENDYESFRLAELHEQLHLLDFLVEPELERRRREEKVSLEAGALIGKVYDLLRAQYIDPESDASQHSLNVLCVRLVFLLFAEDSGIFPKDAFYDYLYPVPADRARTALRDLFEQLKTPDSERDPYASDALKAFPYVNGGLFEADVEIPQLTQEIVEVLLDEVSRGTDWSQISPTVFGGVFESTLNPETRRSGGMHYTSPQNIHKLIDPLFLDDLKAELDTILTAEGVGDRKRRNDLIRFHDKIAALTFFDPACGSGNFLTETYIQLRKLENKILSVLHHDQGQFGLTDEASPLKVSLKQFHGIEINDFAVNVATTALWIAELQANAEADTIVYGVVQDLPLRDSAHVVLGNALQTDWADVLDPSECDYIIGNPPFRGARYQSKEQKAEIAQIFKGARNAGNIDYVAGWYLAAAKYMGDHSVRAAFVSTNSICQGEQVANVWSPIYDLGVRIDFAHDTFRWTTDASGAAAVHVSIVGFSKQGGPKRLFHYAVPDAQPVLEHPAQLNAYLKDAPDVFVWSRPKPLCDVPVMCVGSQLIDFGNYLLSTQEKDELIANEPAAAKYVRRFYGGKELLHDLERWVLYLADVDSRDLKAMPSVAARIRKVEMKRAASGRGQTKKSAATPHKFGSDVKIRDHALALPQTSGERRKYIPIAYTGSEALYSQKAYLIPDASVYHFGVLHSRIHNAWMRQVAGRLESRYSYSIEVVYNNFIWPEVSEAQQAEIAERAEAVLEARNMYPNSTLSELYEPKDNFLRSDLVAAHEALDDAVERAYGLEPGLEEKDLVAHLFELYRQATEEA